MLFSTIVNSLWRYLVFLLIQLDLRFSGFYYIVFQQNHDVLLYVYSRQEVSHLVR